MIELSVVIPVRNEAPSLPELHGELAATLDAWGRAYEIIFVDDGSTDESFEILARLQSIDPHLRVIRLRRNSDRRRRLPPGSNTRGAATS